MSDHTPIVAGRKKKDLEKYGTKGAILIGRKYFEEDQHMVLRNGIYIDVTTSHVMFICGKRGGGKSYTMGVIAEGFSEIIPEIKNNLSIILLDTMGVYWTMKNPNHDIKPSLLEEYKMHPHGVDVKIFTPKKYYEEYKSKGIATDFPFTLSPSVLDQDDWCNGFKIGKYSETGILIGDVISALKETQSNYSISDIMDEVKKHNDSPEVIKKQVISMFNFAKSWGVFDTKGTELSEISKGGQITILDVSCYATMPGGWDVKALIVGLIAKHLFVNRMDHRKKEELDVMKRTEQLYQDLKDTEIKTKEDKMPLVWLVIDEAHEFLPKDETAMNAATMPLIEILREGRQPGISLILATQQPGKIHTDVLTQSDIVLTHRITADIDISAFNLLAQSYNRDGLRRAIEFLPRENGTAVLFDDANEEIHQLKVRPRVSWHGGASPTAFKK